MPMFVLTYMQTCYFNIILLRSAAPELQIQFLRGRIELRWSLHRNNPKKQEKNLARSSSCLDCCNKYLNQCHVKLLR